MIYSDGFTQTITFRLAIEREDRGILDMAITVKEDAAGISKAKKSLRRSLDEYAPLPPVPAQDIPLPLESEEPEVQEPAANPPEDERPEEAPAPENTPANPPEAARGLLLLRCPECWRTFGTFLNEYQSQFPCRCGHRIDLTVPLARYRFTCPCCGKVTWGKTNLEDPDITIRCKCGADVDLRWNAKAREYQNRRGG